MENANNKCSACNGYGRSHGRRCFLCYGIGYLQETPANTQEADKEDNKASLYKTEAQKPGDDEQFLAKLFHTYDVFQRTEDFEKHYSMISELMKLLKQQAKKGWDAATIAANSTCYCEENIVYLNADQHEELKDQFLSQYNQEK
jgi:hypothetical protein